jgi:hypothetical protein
VPNILNIGRGNDFPGLLSNSSTERTQTLESRSDRPAIEYRANDRTLALVLLTMGMLGVALFSSVTFASVAILTRHGNLPSMVTITGSITLASTAKDTSVTLIDVAYPQHNFSTTITGSSYSVTVANGHWYRVQIYSTVQTNNCYYNQAGNYVCLQLPQNCFKGPIEVNTQANIMRYDLDCTHA